MSTKNKHKSSFNLNATNETNATNAVKPLEVIEDSVNITNNKESIICDTESTKEDCIVSRPVETKKISYEYKVVTTTNNLELFQMAVTDYLNNGWDLSGGVSCTMYSDSYSALTIWSQAVCKKNSN